MNSKSQIKRLDALRGIEQHVRSAPRPVYSLETKNAMGFAFSHRIRCNDGRDGAWVGYTSISVLDDHCTATPYLIGGNKVKILSAVEFITAMAGRRL